MKYLIITVLILILFSSCLIRENRRPERNFYLGHKLTDSLELEVKFGSYEKIYVEDFHVYKIKLNQLMGGDAYLFGFIKMYNHNPDNEAHIILRDCKDSIIRMISFIELNAFKIVNVDTMSVYLIENL
ncbi:MAG TPA: hypothetical protein PK006_12865 [Saprospiraceae bacterium]|nr:hypothetical protein [Saprospiraceae bacterium]